MKSLEFENLNLSDKKENEGIVLSDFQSQKVTEESMSQEQAVDLSTKILSALSDKVLNHNKDGNHKTTLNQLKKVFIRGVEFKKDDKFNNITSGMARVNMFLKMKSGKEVVSFIRNNVVVEIEGSIDMAESMSPFDEDFSSAKEDIEKYSLSDFFSVEQLYLDNYKPIEIDWS